MRFGGLAGHFLAGLGVLALSVQVRLWQFVREAAGLVAVYVTVALSLRTPRPCRQFLCLGDVNVHQSTLLIDAAIVERACVWQGAILTPPQR